ncbi:PilN domain-containing protein [Bradyrhizobium oligotrophicum]|uniref:PilN domain-containing protein n=1 Tax=Bradyrhizobium oligotrophicum TaxID=44255 RepID=UPI003EC05606
MTIRMRARREFSAWIGSAAEAIVDTIGRLSFKRPVELVETERDVFIISAGGRSVPPDVTIRLSQGDAVELPSNWSDVLRGSRIEITLLPDRFLWRPLDLPKRAVEFLDSMIRSQLDRLTPWTTHEAVFGSTAPVEIPGDRIRTIVVAAPRSRIDPLVRLAESWRAASVVLFAAAETGPDMDTGQPLTARATRLIEQQLRGSLDIVRVSRMLTAALIIAAVAATLSLALTSFVGARFEDQQRMLSQKIAERRAALRLGTQGGDNAALNSLLRRKQETAADVMLLEALSRMLPDETYVTELRIDKDRLQIAGVSQDAPALIGLIEQSPHFTRATFSAPTTRSADEAGQRFHIEASIKPHFGPGT